MTNFEILNEIARNEGFHDWRHLDRNSCITTKQVEIAMDAQTIAGIELALKKAAEHVCMVHHDGRTKFDHNLGYFQNGADNIQVDKNSILELDPAAILSELKNDIKEG